MKKIFFYLLICFLIPSVLVSAQSGCFTYPDSTFYCNEMEMEPAQQECLFYNDCSLEKYFFSGETCQNQDKFSFCQKVECKSTCRQEFLGKCSAGSLELSEKESWCSAGCCQFQYSEGEYCGFKKNRWSCEIESKNKEATSYSFNSPLSEDVCLRQCGKSGAMEGPNQAEQNRAEKDNSSRLVSLPVHEEKETDFPGISGIFWWVLLILLISLGIYYWN